MRRLCTIARAVHRPRSLPRRIRQSDLWECLSGNDPRDPESPVIYWLHRLATPLSRALPVWLSYGLCSLFAPWVFLVWREKREHALENMRAVLGDDADPRLVRRMARRAFTNYA